MTNDKKPHWPFSCNLALAMMCMSTMSGRRPSLPRFLWSLAASSGGQNMSAAQSTIDSPPLQRTLSSASLAAELLVLDRGSSVSAVSCDFLHRGEVLVNVLVLTSAQLLDSGSLSGCSTWLAVCPTSVVTTSELSELDSEAALRRCDFFGRVKVLVSMPESAHTQDTSGSHYMIGLKVWQLGFMFLLVMWHCCCVRKVVQPINTTYVTSQQVLFWNNWKKTWIWLTQVRLETASKTEVIDMATNMKAYKCHMYC